MSRHYLDMVKWSIPPIVNYRGILVEKDGAWYKVLGESAPTAKRVDEIIDKARLSLLKSLK